MKKIMLFLAPLFVFYLSACSAAQSQQVDVYGTSIAAQSQLQISGMALTGTAQAPIVHITETNAAFDMIQTYAAATQNVSGTQTAVPMTATAQSWTPTPTFTPTPNVTSTLIMIQARSTISANKNDAQIDSLRVQRAQDTNSLLAASPYIIGGAFLVTLITAAGVFIFIHARRQSYISNPVDGRGKPMPMINVVDGVSWDINGSANGVVGTTRKFLAGLPEITTARQDAVIERAQSAYSRERVARLPRPLLAAQSVTPALLPEPARASDKFLLPSWDIINGWDGNGIPYFTARGLEEIDLDRYPHLAVIGTTRTGKSRRGFRPAIAALLASGNRVVIVGKSTDYWPFENHPNATIIKISRITEPAQAQRYAEILKSIVEEMNRRDDVLTASHKSTWTHAGRQRTFIALDEFGNALRQLGSEAKQARTHVESLVAEGAKNGINILLANQRATGMASILSQMGKAIFRVEPDEERRHDSLAGASALDDGYFLAKFGITKLAGAFEPSDDELKSFLASRPVPPLEREDWIDGYIVGEGTAALDQPVSVPDIQPAQQASERVLSADQLEIVKSMRDKSTTAIVQAIWKNSGGTAFYWRAALVNEALHQIEKEPGATSTSGQNTPIFGTS